MQRHPHGWPRVSVHEGISIDLHRSSFDELGSPEFMGRISLHVATQDAKKSGTKLSNDRVILKWSSFILDLLCGLVQEEIYFGLVR